MNYAKAIKELRQKMTISQTELGHILGVAFSTINRWENGRQTPTNFKTKRKLNKLLDKYGIKAD